MPALRVPLTGNGALAPVLISDATDAGGIGIPARALFDTGANRTAIRPGIARELGLEESGSVDVTRIDSEGSASIVRVPFFLIYLQFDPGPDGVLTIATDAIEIVPATPGVVILIGVDALLRMQIDWDGPGWVATFTR